MQEEEDEEEDEEGGCVPASGRSEGTNMLPTQTAVNSWQS